MINRHFALAAIALACAVAATSAQQNPFLGRWNLTGTGENSSYVYWLELKQEAPGKLTGHVPQSRRASSAAPDRQD